mmetsp:Transcript_181/g.467  ORF Transcript_181/g.467 Transcript_181/m.467 type:complete len:226 (-) Transcript_181:988-1665(-)
MLFATEPPRWFRCVVHHHIHVDAFGLLHPHLRTLRLHPLFRLHILLLPHLRLNVDHVLQALHVNHVRVLLFLLCDTMHLACHVSPLMCLLLHCTLVKPHLLVDLSLTSFKDLVQKCLTLRICLLLLLVPSPLVLFLLFPDETIAFAGILSLLLHHCHQMLTVLPRLLLSLVTLLRLCLFLLFRLEHSVGHDGSVQVRLFLGLPLSVTHHFNVQSQKLLAVLLHLQ